MKRPRITIAAAALSLICGLAFASGSDEPDAVRVQSGSVARFGTGGRQPGHISLPGSIGPEGKLYAAVAESGTLVVGECSSGRLLYRAGRLARADAAAFSPDGKRIVVSLMDGSVNVLDARSGSKILGLRSEQHACTSATFSPNGKYVAFVIAGRGIAVFDAVSGTARMRVPDQKHGPNVAVFSPDGSYLASVGRDGSLYVFEVASGRQVLQTIGFRRGAFSPDGRFLLALGENQGAFLLELPSGRQRLKLSGEEHAVTSAQFSADSRTLATVSRDGIMRLWETSNGRMRSNVKVSTGGGLAVDTTPNSGVTALWQSSDSVLVGDLMITR
jgi:WD40 repeat protein